MNQRLGSCGFGLLGLIVWLGLAAGAGAVETIEIDLPAASGRFEPVVITITGIDPAGPEARLNLSLTNDRNHYSPLAVAYRIFEAADKLGQPALEPVLDNNGRPGNNSWLVGPDQLRQLAKDELNQLAVVLDIPESVAPGSYGRAITVNDSSGQTILNQLLIVNINQPQLTATSLGLDRQLSQADFNRRRLEPVLLNSGDYYLPRAQMRLVAQDQAQPAGQPVWQSPLVGSGTQTGLGFWPGSPRQLTAELDVPARVGVLASQNQLLLKLQIAVNQSYQEIDWFDSGSQADSGSQRPAGLSGAWIWFIISQELVLIWLAFKLGQRQRRPWKRLSSTDSRTDRAVLAQSRSLSPAADEHNTDPDQTPKPEPPEPDPAQPPAAVEPESDSEPVDFGLGLADDDLSDIPEQMIDDDQRPDKL